MAKNAQSNVSIEVGSWSLTRGGKTVGGSISYRRTVDAQGKVTEERSETGTPLAELVDLVSTLAGTEAPAATPRGRKGKK